MAFDLTKFLPSDFSVSIDITALHSNEELYFSWFLEDLKKEGIVITYNNIEKQFEIGKTVKRTYIKKMKRIDDKIIEDIIVPSIIYTPDYFVKWDTTHPGTKFFIGEYWNNYKKYSIRNTPIVTIERHCSDNTLDTYIEIKPDFDKVNMTRLFKRTQLAILESTGTYVSLVKVPSLFKKTFVPSRYIYTDKKTQKRKLKYKAKSLKQFIKDKK
jgi:hypothetical protein